VKTFDVDPKIRCICGFSLDKHNFRVAF